MVDRDTWEKGGCKRKKHEHLSKSLGKTSNLFVTCLHNWVQGNRVITLVQYMMTTRHKTNCLEFWTRRSINIDKCTDYHHTGQTGGDSIRCIQKQEPPSLNSMFDHYKQNLENILKKIRKRYEMRKINKGIPVNLIITIWHLNKS